MTVKELPEGIESSWDYCGRIVREANEYIAKTVLVPASEMRGESGSLAPALVHLEIRERLMRGSRP